MGSTAAQSFLPCGSQPGRSFSLIISLVSFVVDEFNTQPYLDTPLLVQSQAKSTA